MNKYELIEAIATTAGTTKAQAERCLNATTDSIVKAVAEGETVQLVGFGSFSHVAKEARDGRNPQTGLPLKIAARKVVKFTVGALFKEAVNTPVTKTKAKAADKDKAAVKVVVKTKK